MTEPRITGPLANGARSLRARALGWLKNLTLFLVLFIVASAVMDYWRGRHLAGQSVPAIDLSTLEGSPVDLVALSEERPVLVYFWATWCGVCTVVSPTIDWFAGEHEVISIALTSGDDARLHRYMEAHEYDFPVVNDPRGELANAWEISATPTVAIVRHGKIVSFTTGVTTPPGLWWRLWRAGS
ncbi:protein disulfide oxidoreductase [Marinimicrobium sp. ARAG 43.8]|uniref:protein disulfide oxidoreductase n=1 Tax=Marinimicrobium sp. ARAG 43.8 TaxID=3418719 RepID=UPI003CF55657